MCADFTDTFALECVIAENVGARAACAVLRRSVGRVGEAEFSSDADVKNPRGKAVGWVASTHRNEGVGRV